MFVTYSVYKNELQMSFLLFKLFLLVIFTCEFLCIHVKFLRNGEDLRVWWIWDCDRRFKLIKSWLGFKERRGWDTRRRGLEEEESFSYRESVKRSRTRASLPDRCQPEKEGVRASATMKLLQEAEEATNNKKVKKEKNNFDFFYSHGQMQPLWQRF